MGRAEDSMKIKRERIEGRAWRTVTKGEKNIRQKRRDKNWVEILDIREIKEINRRCWKGGCRKWSTSWWKEERE